MTTRVPHLQCCQLAWACHQSHTNWSTETNQAIYRYGRAAARPPGSKCQPPKHRREGRQATMEDQEASVTSILEWVQCFGIYIDVIAAKHPERIQDLLGYQALIIEACGICICIMRYGMGSDQPHAVEYGIHRSSKGEQCKYCFSLSHLQEDCDWGPAPPSAQVQPNSGMTTPWQEGNRSCTSQICYAWNHSPEPNCVYPGCRYHHHICLHCARNPQVTNMDHKAMYCGYWCNLQPKPLAGIKQQSGPSSYHYHPLNILKLLPIGHVVFIVLQSFVYRHVCITISCVASGPASCALTMHAAL